MPLLYFYQVEVKFGFFQRYLSNTSLQKCANLTEILATLKLGAASLKKAELACPLSLYAIFEHKTKFARLKFANKKFAYKSTTMSGDPMSVDSGFNDTGKNYY